jgi:hypothetical protein
LPVRWSVLAEPSAKLLRQLLKPRSCSRIGLLGKHAVPFVRHDLIERSSGGRDIQQFLDRHHAIGYRRWTVFGLEFEQFRIVVVNEEREKLARAIERRQQRLGKACLKTFPKLVIHDGHCIPIGDGNPVTMK